MSKKYRQGKPGKGLAHTHLTKPTVDASLLLRLGQLSSEDFSGIQPDSWLFRVRPELGSRLVKDPPATQQWIEGAAKVRT